MSTDDDNTTKDTESTEEEKELEINKETVEDLDDEQLEGVVGGRASFNRKLGKGGGVTSECETKTCCTCDGKISAVR